MRLDQLERLRQEQRVELFYFPCEVRVHGKDIFVVWHEDRFVLRPDGQLLRAWSLGELVSDADEMGLSLIEDEPVRYDFDRLRDWCAEVTAEGVDCPDFLNAWNFFDDLAKSHEDSESVHFRVSRSADHIYEKLFWGNNLPSVTPPGERFAPVWSTDELAEIRRLIESGLQLVEEMLGRSGPTKQN